MFALPFPVNQLVVRVFNFEVLIFSNEKCSHSVATDLKKCDELII